MRLLPIALVLILQLPIADATETIGVATGPRTISEVTSLKAAGEKDAYLTRNGKLTHAIVLKDAQGGFAGFSGHIWTVEPDGSWRREPFLNRNIRKPDREGRFTPEQLAALAKHLAAHDLMGLPRQIGRNVGANPHVFTITFGQKQSSLTVRPGAPLPTPDARDVKTDPQARFVAIAQKLQQDARPRAVEN